MLRIKSGKFAIPGTRFEVEETKSLSTEESNLLHPAVIFCGVHYGPKGEDHRNGNEPIIDLCLAYTRKGTNEHVLLPISCQVSELNHYKIFLRFEEERYTLTLQITEIKIANNSVLIQNP